MAECTQQGRLAKSGDTFKQYVPAGHERDDYAFDDVLMSNDDLADLVANELHLIGDGLKELITSNHLFSAFLPQRLEVLLYELAIGEGYLVPTDLATRIAMASGGRGIGCL